MGADMSYTPGPWELVPAKNPSYRFVSADGWNKLARVVVRMEGTGFDCADGAANAHLIAAAPELLEALVLCLHVVSLVGLGGDFSAEKARHAISKARGES